MNTRTNGRHSLRIQRKSDETLAKTITKAASKHTYYTIRLLVDRDRVPDAFRAYAYFRWLDDRLDQSRMDRTERIAFVERQLWIMDQCYSGKTPSGLLAEERMIASLIQSDPSRTSGLHAYLQNMMNVMAFDAARRGCRISQAELASYTQFLAIAVTEALHYFIGHCCFAPREALRYMAVSAAHITHMLRDTLDDTPAGYFNIPEEYLETHGIHEQDVESEAYLAWVMNRVLLARKYFEAGKNYLMQVGSLRCRIAGFAYVARFEKVLNTIERDGFQLRKAYPEINTPVSFLQIACSTLSRANKRHRPQPFTRTLTAR